MAKNVLTIGAVSAVTGGYQNPEEVKSAYFSSWGSTDDGRTRPDLVGNGVGVFSSVATSDAAYDSYDGTSMAAPNITCSMFLLQEQYAKLHQNATMRAATLKGLVIHTADEVGKAAGPDYIYGWSLLNTAKAAALILNSDATHLLAEKN
ncbi:S8 family serine peptidase [Adhaeribacter arboris]|uniref:S8 family serine peptidase n=1 Tax=Adhaeribacter arboris TaxID=2072846 RepID=UPI00130485B4|nr:S8 family serine peptidase [Adhaeribacter arboris]